MWDNNGNLKNGNNCLINNGNKAVIEKCEDTSKSSSKWMLK